MKYLTKVIVMMLAVSALAACEKKETEPEEIATTGAEAPMENIVALEIPEEYATEAEREVTEENAEQVAADLERELDAELN